MNEVDGILPFVKNITCNKLSKNKKQDRNGFFKK